MVNVQGSSISADGAILATSQSRCLAGLGAAANDKGQIEGLITQFTSASDFVVDGQRVTAGSTTELVLRGTTLALNVPVKVRGTFDANGVLVAARIEVKPQSSARVQGLVGRRRCDRRHAQSAWRQHHDDFGNDLQRQGRSAAEVLQAVGRSHRRLRRSAWHAGHGSALSATIVERQQPNNRSYLRGVASNLASPSFVVLGVTVMTDTQTQFLGLGSQTQAQVAFFAQANGQIVRVRGTYTGGVFLADQVQIDP